MIETIKDILQPIDYDDIYTAYIIFDLLKSKGFDLDDFHNVAKDIILESNQSIIDYEKNNPQKKGIHKNMNYVCPDCGYPRVVQPVSIRQGKNNMLGYQSVLRCYECGNEKFYRIDTNALIDLLR